MIEYTSIVFYITIIIGLAVILLSYIRKGSLLTLIPFCIRQIIFIWICIGSILVTVEFTVNSSQRLFESFSFRSSIPVIAALGWIDITYQIIKKQYTWVQRLLKK